MTNIETVYAAGNGSTLLTGFHKLTKSGKESIVVCRKRPVSCGEVRRQSTA